MKLKRLIPFTIGFLVVTALVMFGQAGGGTVTSTNGPLPIPDALKTRYWKTRAEASEASAKAAQATAESQTKTAIFMGVLNELNQACGDHFQLTMKDDDLVCDPKPEEKKPEQKPQVQKP